MSGNAGTDKAALGGPTLTIGGAVVGGQVVSRVPAFTKLVAWGAEDNFAWLNDIPAQSIYGVLTRFLDVEEIADQASLATAMTSALNDEKTNREAISAKLNSAGSIIPFVDFDLGDNLIWQVPPAKGKHERRVQTISWRTTKN